MVLSSLTYEEKVRKLGEVRQSIKKKRLVLDESVERFGLKELRQLMEVKDKDQVKGYPLCGTDKSGLKLGMKVIPLEAQYNKAVHPAMLESLYLKEVTEHVVNTRVSPHIVSYLGSQRVSNNSKALRFLNLKTVEIENQIRSSSCLLLSEFVEGGSLESWTYDMYEKKEKVSDLQWKMFAFQLVYTLAVLQKKYKMMHNDCHYGNILIDDTIRPEGYFVYNINGKEYFLKNTGVIPKLWDFEFAQAYTSSLKWNYKNAYIQAQNGTRADNRSESTDDNVPDTYNEEYDLHYLLTSLLDLYISQELFDWIIQLYPDELIPEDSSNEVSSENEDHTMTSNGQLTDGKRTKYLKGGRIVNGMEKYFKLPTPIQVLESDFFKEFLEKPLDFSDAENIFFGL